MSVIEIERACAWRLPRDERIADCSRRRTSMVLSSMHVADEDIDTSVLMVSELATNAHQHAAAPYGLRIWCAGAIAIIEVFDRTQQLPPLPCTVPSSATGTGDIVLELVLLEEHGRGLPLVQHYSGGQCGADLHTAGKRAWFAVPRVAAPGEYEDALSSIPTMLAVAPSASQLALAQTV